MASVDNYDFTQCDRMNENEGEGIMDNDNGRELRELQERAYQGDIDALKDIIQFYREAGDDSQADRYQKRLDAVLAKNASDDEPETTETTQTAAEAIENEESSKLTSAEQMQEEADLAGEDREALIRLVNNDNPFAYIKLAKKAKQENEDASFYQKQALRILEDLGGITPVISESLYELNMDLGKKAEAEYMDCPENDRAERERLGKEAFTYYTNAFELEVPDAGSEKYDNLIRCYEQGIGTPIDPIQADKYRFEKYSSSGSAEEIMDAADSIENDSVLICDLLSECERLAQDEENAVFLTLASAKKDMLTGLNKHEDDLIKVISDDWMTRSFLRNDIFSENFVSQKRHDDGGLFARAEIELNDSSAYARFLKNAGLICMKGGAPDKAWELWEKAASVGNPDAYIAMGDAILLTGNDPVELEEKAAPYYNEALSAGADNSVVEERISGMKKRIEELKKAAEAERLARLEEERRKAEEERRLELERQKREEEERLEAERRQQEEEEQKKREAEIERLRVEKEKERMEAEAQAKAEADANRKKLIRYALIVIGAVVAFNIIKAIYTSFMYSINKVDLFEYLTVEFDGYDGFGHYSTKTDTAGLTNAGFPEGSVFFTQPEQMGGLSNGDTVEFSVQIRRDQITKKWATPEQTVKQYTVTGLKDLQEVDLFSQAVVTFSGMEGSGTISATMPEDSPLKKAVTFDFSRSEGLSQGDKVTVTVSISDDVMAEQGICPAETEKVYTVPELGRLLVDISLLDSETFQDVIAAGKAKIMEGTEDSSYTFYQRIGQSYLFSTYYSITSVNAEKAYLINKGDSNTLYLVYKFTGEYGNNADSAKPVTAYDVVAADNVFTNNAGDILLTEDIEYVTAYKEENYDDIYGKYIQNAISAGHDVTEKTFGE